MFRTRFVCIGFLIAVMSTGILLQAVAAATNNTADYKSAKSRNLIQNPSFEERDGKTPAGWEKQTWDGQAKLKYVPNGRSGKWSVMIASEQGADVGWQMSVPVETNSKYRLSGWIKTENLVAGAGKGALLNLHNIQPLQTPAVTGTNDWTRVELVFDSADSSVVEINCLLGGWGLSMGKAWFDDLRLELLFTKTSKPTVEINASEIKEPISKYIYGQFIEHLGRCIDGGIWAEMLEGRKFYYAVGAPESPWKTIDPNQNIVMVSQNSYVGEQTPEVQLPADGTQGGIEQGKLALIKGKEYTGRVILAGSGSAKVKVSLVWGPGENDRQTITIDTLDAEYTKTPFSFTAGADTNDARLEIVGSGTGAFRIGTVSLMPADNVNGMRADTLKLLKELDSPIYRWPGGNFVSGYDWRDGIGDRDKRPPRKNPAWKGVEYNDMGLDEFFVFCRLLGTEPMLAVNTGFGDDHSAAEEVEYVNGAADTRMGKLRAANGHPEPYNVRWWCIGNEMFGEWQLGHMAVKQYVIKHNLFAKAMLKVDPTIKIVAVGSCTKSIWRDAGENLWSEIMFENCAANMDTISEHLYRREKKSSVYEHVRQIPEAINNIVTAHRDYRKRLKSLKGRDIRIAIDEWNYWYGPYLYGELGTRYFLKDALGIAAGLHEMVRNSDIIFMANYAQAVNVIGCIKTNKTDAAFATTGLPLKLYRRHFGTLPVAVAGSVGPLDVVAAWTSDRKALTIAVVNPTETKYELVVDIKGAVLSGKGRMWQIANSDPMAYNDPGKAPKVVIEEKPLSGVYDSLSVPPFSINLYELPAR